MRVAAENMEVPPPVAGASLRWHFLLRTAGIHVVTYFVIGMIAAMALDYEAAFAEPAVRDYMRPYGSVALLVGPAVQVLRGALVAAVLLPIRPMLPTRWGWVKLWLLLVVIGILSTSAAAPSSIEGVVYTRLPLWYHAFGLPEMLTQTLVFSLLVAFYERHPSGLVAALPVRAVRILTAGVSASLAFIGYAVFSVLFALVNGADIGAVENLNWTTQGVFVTPFLANSIIVYRATRSRANWRTSIVSSAASYAIGAISILLYQELVTGEASALYGFLAPILPAALVGLVVRYGGRELRTAVPARAR